MSLKILENVSKYENIKRQQQETWIVLTAGTPPSWCRLNFACMSTVKTSMASFKSQQYPRRYRRLYRSDRWHIITYLRQYHGDGLDKYVAIKAHKRWLGRRGSEAEGKSEHEAAWTSGLRVGPAIQRPKSVWVPLWPIAGFVLGRLVFKSSSILINSQLVAFGQLKFLTLLCYIWIICF